MTVEARRGQELQVLVNHSSESLAVDTRHRDKFTNSFSRAMKPNLMTEINGATLFGFHGLKWIDHLVVEYGMST